MSCDLAAADELIRETVLANRILGTEGILDAYGHVSQRLPDRPDRFVMSVARAPELVAPDDIVELAVATGEPDERPPARLYLERYIHAAVYAARPDVMAVCHNHALSVLPFAVVPEVPMRAVIHVARFLGAEVPVWDIADDFGTSTIHLVTSMDHGRSLATALGDRNAVLLRGHGSVVTGLDARHLVERCVHMDRNARVQLAAQQLGGTVVPLHHGECEAPFEVPPRGGDTRAWDYYVRRTTQGAGATQGRAR